MSTPAHGLLKGKTGIITGALVDSSIAWKIAEAVHREGGRFAFVSTHGARIL